MSGTAAAMAPACDPALPGQLPCCRREGRGGAEPRVAPWLGGLSASLLLGMGMGWRGTPHAWHTSSCWWAWLESKEWWW